MNSDVVIHALAAKTGFEAVQVGGNESYLRLVGRVPQARMPDLMALFDLLVSYGMDSEAWNCDLSKWYFRPEGAAEKVFAWRFIFESKDAAVPLPVDRIASVISSMRGVTHTSGGGPLQEIKLAGFSTLRNGVTNTGKGAAPMGKAVVGPMRRGY